MKHVYEATYAQLDEVIKVINQYWDKRSENTMIKEEIKSRSYWEGVHRKGRVIIYKVDNNEVEGVISLFKEGKQVKIDVFFIVPPLKEQGIEYKMLRIAERIAVNWSAEQISWLFSGKEEIEKEFPVFEKLGYILHCPINQKGFVLLEKKVV